MKRTTVWAVAQFLVPVAFIPVVWPLPLWRYSLAVALLLAMSWVERAWWYAHERQLLEDGCDR